MYEGLGLSLHGKFRLVTETTSTAMPATGIGFIPDVGASFFLSCLPGSLGMPSAAITSMGPHSIRDCAYPFSLRPLASDHSRRQLPGPKLLARYPFKEKNEPQ
ncbi:enoyl-CoA hydratase/isomerase family protein [Arthrobacter sp. NPDC093125]|uniref:enoyl-CoA hydratase/isomerase family protein n=1 Tax=Arthrobacter sp. NPDC093125 TaxID=3363944 RepID=UPI00382E416C